MKFKKYLILLLIPACLGCEKREKASANNPFKPALVKIDSIINDVTENRQVPGYTISITYMDSLIFSKSYGYADLKLKKRADEKTLFQIGSITKSFTAIALMKLYEEGKFDPNVPLSEYLHWFNINGGNPAVTGHHLLTHTAGILRGNDEIYPSPAMGVIAGQLTSFWEPGAKFHYSNCAYAILHLLIEKLSGLSYNEYIEQNILEPLNMKDTRVGIRLDSRALQAVGYVYPYDDRPHHTSRDLVEANFFEYDIGDGCIQSTAEDMAKYMIMLKNKGAYMNGKIISEQAFDLFTGLSAQHSSESWYQYGIGVTQNNEEIILSHSGGMVGFTSNMIVDMSNEIGVYTATNSRSVSVYDVSNYAIQAIKSVLDVEKLPEFESSNKYIKTNLDQYVGEYVGRNDNIIKIVSESDSLFIESNNRKIYIFQYDSSKFYTPETGFDQYYWSFVKSDSTKWYRLIYGNQIFFPSGVKQSNDSGPSKWKEFIGKYRSYSPWLPYFEVIERNDELIVIWFYGSESSLIETSNSFFKIDDKDSPEFIEFVSNTYGHTLIAKVSGHTFYWLGQ